MKNSIVDQAKVAEYRADFMERTGSVSSAARLVERPENW